MSQWLRDLQTLWVQRIQEAEEAKEKHFGRTASELWDLLTRSYQDLYLEAPDDLIQSAFRFEDNVPEAYYRCRINKIQEFVDLYLPFVLAQNPIRQVTIRRPQFPEEILQAVLQTPLALPIPYAQVDKSKRIQLQTAALLLEWWLNFCSQEYQLLREARLAVIEALVKGRGLLWHSLIETSSGLIPASFFESVDNLFIDPTAITLRDAGYIIRKRRLAAWQAAEQLQIPESILLHITSRSPIEAQLEYADVPVVEFYEIYSRIGAGSRLCHPDDPLREVHDALEALGPYVRLVIARDAEYPLNLHPDVLEGDTTKLRSQVEWPIMTFGDTLNPWPMSVLDFYPHTDNPWARSPVAPGQALQVVLDHLYSLLYSQARRSMCTLIIVPEHVDSRLEKSLRFVQDFEVVKLSSRHVTDLSKELYNILTPPPVSKDLWAIIQSIEVQFGKAVGLDPFLYGSQPETQPRSAAEVQIRYRAASGRAQAMAERVEDWLSQAARKDGLISRLYVPWTQMAELFGEPPITLSEQPVPAGPLSAIWATVISSTDPVQAGADFNFSIVAGSGRRQDREQQVQALQWIAQTVLPVAMQVGAKTGDFTHFNRFLEQVSHALEMDMSLFRIEQPPTIMQGASNGQAQTHPPTTPNTRQTTG
ncbi:MAG: hypothetical protein NZ821_05980 [Gloeomargarita sp. SKYB31]|nr:hypothetical protein [Gloeomargarita sp. SKYB31]